MCLPSSSLMHASHSVVVARILDCASSVWWLMQDLPMCASLSIPFVRCKYFNLVATLCIGFEILNRLQGRLIWVWIRNLQGKMRSLRFDRLWHISFVYVFFLFVFVDFQARSAAFPFEKRFSDTNHVPPGTSSRDPCWQREAIWVRTEE